MSFLDWFKKKPKSVITPEEDKERLLKCIKNTQEILKSAEERLDKDVAFRQYLIRRAERKRHRICEESDKADTARSIRG